MKKLATYIFLLVVVVTFSGCKHKEKQLQLNKIDKSTVLVKENNQLQVVNVEDFTENYFEKEELQEFVNQQIEAYCLEQNEQEVVKFDALSVEDGIAKLSMKYSDFSKFAEFNGLNGKMVTKVEDSTYDELPKELVDAENNETVATKDVLSEETYKVIIIEGEYDLLVSSKIKYYSNGELLEEKCIRTSKDGVTIVAY